jgi:putative FmdB family regulatory protein
MPSYEFRCQDCRRKFDIFISYADYGKRPVVCPHCQGENVQRKIGRVRVARSEESRIDSIADPSLLAGMEDDPRALGRAMREMSREMGEDMGGEMNEVIERLESGQPPEQIERDLPDLSADSGPAGMPNLPLDD